MICNNKGPDQPAHPRSLIGNFVVCLLRRIIPGLASFEKKFNFLSSLFSRRDWFETRFVGNPEDRFSRVVACVACSTALGQTLQVQQIIILKTNTSWLLLKSRQWVRFGRYIEFNCVKTVLL